MFSFGGDLAGRRGKGSLCPPMLQQIIDGMDVGVGQPWFWAWVGAGLISLLVLPCLHHQGELSSIALASSPLAVMSKGQGRFSSFQALMVGSPTPTPSGSALLLPTGGVGATLLSAAAYEGLG